MKINKRQRNYLRGFLAYSSKLEDWGWRGKEKWLWNGDECCPGTKGPVCDSLLEMGILEELWIAQTNHWIRPTDLGMRFKCRMCSHGRRFNDYGDDIGKCGLCEGTGVLLQSVR